MNRRLLTAAAMALLIMCVKGAVAMSAGHKAFATDQAGMSQTIGSQSPPRILINGMELRMAILPRWKDGLAFVAISDELTDALGASVLAGNAAPLSAEVITSGYKIEFTAGQTEYIVRDITMELPVAAYEEGGYLMVPAREFFEALGFSVKSDEAANVVEVEKARNAQVAPADIIAAVFKTPEAQLPGAATSTAHVATENVEGALEYTYDNLISFDNTAISGKSGLSNLTGASAINNQFSMRLNKPLANGYKFSAALRTTETTDDPMYNMGRVDKLAATFVKGGIALGVYDITPKFSYYALKNYQMRGIQYERALKRFSWKAVWGKSPKILADSEYARYAQGFRIHRSKVKDRDFGVSFVRTRDAGGARTTDRYDNKVFSINNSTKFGKRTKLMMEYAVSLTSVNDNADISGRARTAQAQYRAKKTMCTALYELTGADFDSETAYFTAGRREASAICNHKYSSRAMIGGGYKKTLLGGEETGTIPLLYSIMPLKARPKMKLTMQKNFEKAAGAAGARITDTRSGAYADEFGKFRFDATLDRRRQKESGSATNFRNSQRYRAGAFITKKTELSLQTKKELRTRGANPRTRFSQIRFDHELKPFNDLSLAYSRYYNGTANNRSDTFMGFRKVDIENDTEIGVEYRFLNYRDHNDNVIKLSYSFVK